MHIHLTLKDVYKRQRYKVGTSKYWDGATVFWQTDNQNKVRTGKIMPDESYFAQSMLLSKALRMQQDLEDKKTEVIIEGLEKKIKDHEAALEKKDFVLQTMEGSLTEAQVEIARLNNELLLKSENFEQEKRNLDTKLKAEVKKSSNLQKSLKELQDRCLEFGN